MNKKFLKIKTKVELEKHLIFLYNKKFTFLLDSKTDAKAVKTDLIKKNKREIARTLTLISIQDNYEKNR